jgi:hypothetical protein
MAVLISWAKLSYLINNCFDLLTKTFAPIKQLFWYIDQNSRLIGANALVKISKQAFNWCECFGQ